MVFRVRRFEGMLAAAERGETVDAAALVREAPEQELGPLESRAQQELDRLPVPIGRQVEGPAPSRRRLAERVVAWVKARRGQPQSLFELARQDWLAGGSHARYLRLLMEHGRDSEAVAMARTLLEHGDGRDEEALREIIEDAAAPPDGWMEAVRDFAREPSLEAWERLMGFTPEEVYDQRARYTLDVLRRLHVDPEVLFECATQRGITSDAAELAEKGLVDPRNIEKRARESFSPESRAAWLGLAARSACVRQDRFTTVRLLREALAIPVARELLTRDLAFIRTRADPELKDMLERI